MTSMKKRFIFSLAMAGIMVTAIAVFLLYDTQQDGTIEGKITDALSGDSVWSAQIIIDGRSTFRFFSSTYKLTGIAPGQHILKAFAPNYRPIDKPIAIKKGKNVLDLSLEGLSIPDLHNILIFAVPTERGIQVEIRLLDSEDVAISHYPALPCHLEGSLYLREGTGPPFLRGSKLFEGPIDWFWDPKETLAKNMGIIPWDKVKVDKRQNLFGLLEVTFHTSQGTFTQKTDEVKLSL